jgi:hypothetical protein
MAHSPRPYDRLGVNWSSPPRAQREGSHHRASSSVRTTSPGPNITFRSDEDLLQERAQTSTPEDRLGSVIPATNIGRRAPVASEDPANAVDARIG